MDSVKVPNNEEESGIKRVTIKGFDATGIYPFNHNKVLEKIYDVINNVQETVNDSLITYLNEKWYPTHGLVGRPRKRTRLNISPGESITSRHFNEEEMTASEVENENLVDDDIVINNPNENVQTTEELADYCMPNENLKIGCYVLGSSGWSTIFNLTIY